MTENTQAKAQSQYLPPPEIAPQLLPSPFRSWGKGGVDEWEGSERAPRTCLSSNNSIDQIFQDVIDGIDAGEKERNAIYALQGKLSPYHKKQAHYLSSNVEKFTTYQVQSIEHVGFLTLTFADNVKDNKEASRRWNSFKTNFLSKSPEYGNWLLVKEVQMRGAWHYHILVEMKQNIREGLDFKKFRHWLKSNNRFKKPLPTGNTYFRERWKELQPALEKHNFGKIYSLEPIEKTSEAIKYYVGKYISKHISQRKKEHKGVRLISSSSGWSKNSMHFAWYNENSTEWRRKLALFAAYNGCTELYQLSEKLGSTWAYTHQDDIFNIDQILTESLGVVGATYEEKTLVKLRKALRQRKKTGNWQPRGSDLPPGYMDAIVEAQIKKFHITTEEYIEGWLEEFNKQVHKNKGENQ